MLVSEKGVEMNYNMLKKIRTGGKLMPVVYYFIGFIDLVTLFTSYFLQITRTGCQNVMALLTPRP